MKTLTATRINIMISHMDQSILFYTEVLGLHLLNHWGRPLCRSTSRQCDFGSAPYQRKHPNR
ncbi:VOC family protein [Mangrovimonas futianensis]|uniref:VOC family protein n=1 Tax=Mangrovimonas futianensis TaxID=2895523 RepID=UPI001E567633|nr:VOC family protein [Mangrovimonas futianensis]MCF1422541.1 VOC family protein [Mangrovimonas futianensis]